MLGSLEGSGYLFLVNPATPNLSFEKAVAGSVTVRHINIPTSADRSARVAALLLACFRIHSRFNTSSCCDSPSAPMLTASATIFLLCTPGKKETAQNSHEDHSEPQFVLEQEAGKHAPECVDSRRPNVERGTPFAVTGTASKRLFPIGWWLPVGQPADRHVALPPRLGLQDSFTKPPPF